MKKEALDLALLLTIPHVEQYEGFSISPDGRQVAFSWNATGRWEIYLAWLDRPATPRQITSGPGAKLAPRWSPDGRSLAYLLDLDGGERYDIFCYDLASGAQVNLTPDTPDAIQPHLSWSPDGRWIAFAYNQDGRFDTFLLPSAGGSPQRLVALPYPDWEVHWSPDGEWLAIVCETEGQDYGIFVVAADGDGPPSRIGVGEQPLSARDPCWSPDGRQLAFASDWRGRFELGLYEVASGRVDWLPAGKGDNEAPAWSPDGRQLAYVTSEGPQSMLRVLELARGTVVEYRLDVGIHYAPSFSPAGDRLLCVFDNPRCPADLWSLCLADGSWQQLTHSLPPELADAELVIPEHIRYPGLDGALIPALLFRPQVPTEPGPAVIYVHGGPNWLVQFTWDPLLQHLVSRGWTVLAPNYRGSTGYGRAWQLASRFELGRVDTEDVVAGADFLVQQGLADPARIALTGRSWGGYLTMTCLTGYPERWAAGSAVVPFLNWFTGHANSREDLQHWDLQNMGHPEKDHQRYYERSPYFFLDRVRAPVQLICGAQDPRCPASESLQARNVLVGHGKRCDLALYQDEGHVFLKKENVVDADMRRVSFLAEFLETRQA